ncbi:hypothetical protein GGF31_001094 [Allomyces arbusculus]|nr:hypothetical protein GGF31_001094 [Allomyces arbusculus]
MGTSSAPVPFFLPADRVKKYLQVADGRDKALKIIQYCIKVVLWSELVTKTRHADVHQRIKSVASHFSTTRKILRLAHCVEPYLELRDLLREGEPWRSVRDMAKKGLHTRGVMQVFAVVIAGMGIVNDCVDDVICLAKIGALDKKWVDRLEMTSSRMWMASIIYDILGNLRGMGKIATDLATRQRALATAIASKNADADQLATDRSAVATLEQKLFVQRVSFFKLCADYAFDYVDVFHVTGRRGDGIQAIAGFIAALLSTYKLWLKAK